MKFNKTITTLLLVVLVTSAAICQKKNKDKATEKVNLLNAELVSINPNLALSEDQKKDAYEIYFNGLNALKNAAKLAETEESRKKAQAPIRKEMNTNIRKNVLTKKQRKALSTKKEKEKKK
jgi:hypothetical protein